MDRDGCFDGPADPSSAVEAPQAACRTVFQNEEHLSRRWSGCFMEIAWVRAGVNNYEDLWLFRKI
jgi:hypothetical protein